MVFGIWLWGRLTPPNRRYLMSRDKKPKNPNFFEGSPPKKSPNSVYRVMMGILGLQIAPHSGKYICTECNNECRTPPLWNRWMRMPAAQISKLIDGIRTRKKKHFNFGVMCTLEGALAYKFLGVMVEIKCAVCGCRIKILRIWDHPRHMHIYSLQENNVKPCSALRQRWWWCWGGWGRGWFVAFSFFPS